MKLLDESISHIRIKDNQIWLTINGKEYNIVKLYNIPCESIEYSDATKEEIEKFNSSDREHGITSITEYPGKHKFKGAKIIRRNSTTLSIALHTTTIENKKLVKKPIYTFAFSLIA